MSAPTLGSLYTGVGGGDLGFQRAGFAVAFQAERDPWRRRVLEARWPDARRYVDAEDVSNGLGGGPVDLLYASPPTRDPAWLAPIWPAVERRRPTFLVIEGAIGGDEEAALHAGCTRLEYAAVAVNLACEAERPWGLVRRARTFTVARRGSGEGLSALFALTELAEAYRVREGEAEREPAALTEVVEAVVGLPPGWTCVCQPPTPGDCSESSARLVAANECCSPAMTQWLGAYLRALLQAPPGPPVRTAAVALITAARTTAAVLAGG